MSIIEEIDIGTIEVTDEDVKEFIPDEVMHLVSSTTLRTLCGAEDWGRHAFFPCPEAGLAWNGDTECRGCGQKICSYCALLGYETKHLT